MSTNKTTNYNLHSWIPQDDFHLSEINENFALLDAAVKAEAQSAAQGLATLAARPRVIVGGYTGDGAMTRRIELGATPLAVLVEYDGGQRSGAPYIYGGLAVGENGLLGYCKLDESGFTLQRAYNDSASINTNNYSYHYLAIVA